MADEFKDPKTRKIADFLNEIGISVTGGDVADDTFLPGVAVVNGGLVVDDEKLLYPGDLLHEAGHLAFAPTSIRGTLNGEIVLPDVNASVIEVQAIAWSYAAAVHLRIDPAVVFHENGYRGQSEGILFNYSIGNYLGIHGLERLGMAYSALRAGELGVNPFPFMLRWLVD